MIKVKTQRDFLLTESVFEGSPKEIDDELKGMETTGKMTIQYNEGGILGITVEQKKKLTESESNQVREMLGVKSRNF